MSRTSRLLFSSIPVFLLAASLASAQDTTVVKGERLFKAYCAACHSIGAGVIVGPDLKGVTARRSLSWLKRFISDPGRMVREKDRTAVGLVARFNGYVMPSLGLSEKNITDVTAYLRSRAHASGD
jgi:protein SCO1